MRKADLLLAAAVLLVGVCRVGGQEDNARRGVLVPIPEGVEIDDATLARLAEKYGDEKQSFLKLLLVLEANQIDYSRDSLSDIRNKKAILRQAAGQSHSVVASRFNPTELEIDYVRLCWEVVPRLEPNIVRIGQREQFATLKDALPKLRAGDQLELGAGTFVLPLDPQWQPPSDIAIVGKGQSATVLKPEGEASGMQWQRWRLADMKIDLGGDGARRRNSLPGGSLHIERCTLVGYTMPYGAFAQGGQAVIEDCLFDGSANRMMSRIFGMSGNWNALYLRNTTIEEERMISQITQCPVVLDRCQFKSSQPFYWHGNPVLLRKTTGLQPLPNTTEFEFATDEQAVVDYALGKRKEVDPRIHQLSEATKLPRNPFYWIGLLRNDSREIRVDAAAQVQRLLGQQVDPKLLAPAPQAPVAAAAKEAVAAAIRDLKSDEFATREQARKELLAIGEPAVDALREIAKRGTLEQKRSAEVILLQIVGPADQQPLPRDWELEYGRISRWFEENRSRLVWNELAGRYE